MKDAFSGEEFLLHSESITTLLTTENPVLWLNLIGFNGRCWQTFGPVVYFQGFTSDDIFFFATERNHDIENDADLIKSLQKNSLPYMMLISGANYPISFNGPHELVINSSQIEAKHFDPTQLEEDFEIQKHQNIYRLQLNGWHQLPHFSRLYYDKNDQLLSLNAMTDAGYTALIEHLNRYQITVDQLADIRVHPAMIKTAKDILKKEIPIDPYAELFFTPPEPKEQELADRLNKAFNEIMPRINAGEEPDIVAIAKKYDLDPDQIRKIVSQTKG